MCKWLNEEMNSQAEMTYYKSIIFSQQVRNCRLTGLLDLALEKDYVRTKVADYMNHLIDIGVAGFRLDAAKHMWPGDIKAVLDKLHNLNTKWFSQGSISAFIINPSVSLQNNVKIIQDIFPFYYLAFCINSILFSCVQ